VETIPYSDIKVDPNRMRKTFRGIELLADSIKQNGLIQPIVLDEHNNLLAGGRRMKAIGLLKWDHVPIVRLTDLDPTAQKIVELEENLRREDLTWQEACIAKVEIHDLLVAKHGKATPGGGITKGKGWKLQDTADLLGESIGTTSMDIKLGRELLTKNSPAPNGEEPKKTLIEKTLLTMGGKDLTTLPTKDAAFKILKGQEDLATRKLMAAMTKVDAKTTPKDPSTPTTSLYSLTHCDALEGLKNLPSDSIDLVLTDPPWGVDYDSYSGTRFSGQSVDTHKDLTFLDLIFIELERVMKEGSIGYIFFAFKHLNQLQSIITSVNLSFDPVPLIWVKGNAYNQFAYQRYTHDYEGFLHFWKGTQRRMNSTRGSIFDYKPVNTALKIHPTEKPVELLEELITISTIEGEVVLDPFAGSSSTLEAAIRKDRLGTGFEIDEDHYLKGIIRLKEASLLEGKEGK
jgi:site-specific DNA-methyltransferase (adenine-specific)